MKIVQAVSFYKLKPRSIRDRSTINPIKMVLGSFTVLGKPEQNRLKLQLHVDQQHNMVKNAKGLEQRRKRVALLKRAKELKETSMKARELGLRTEEVTRLRKVFNDVDDDNSGEISLEELVVLCKTIQGGRLSHLTKWDLQTYMDEADDDNSGTLGFDEFLQLVSPRREKYRADKLRKVQKRLNKTKDNHSRMHNSRHKYAWNLYNKYQNQLDRFGRKQGYTQEALQHHVDQFELIDEDGSGSLDVEEILLVWKSLGNNNPPTREAAFEMMKPFDWRRAGRIDLMGFLEMMAPRRLKNMARQKAMQERMKRSLQKQKTLSKNVPLARMKLEEKHANAALKRWSRKLGYKDADVLTIRRQFNEVDTDHSGEIDVDELFHMLQKSHTVPSHLRNKTRLECIDVIDAYDQDKSGTIDFREFLHLISPRNAKYTEQQKMRQANAKQISEIKNMVFSQARYNAAMIKWNKHISRLWKHGQRMGFNNDEIEALKIEFDKYDSDGSGVSGLVVGGLLSLVLTCCFFYFLFVSFSGH